MTNRYSPRACALALALAAAGCITVNIYFPAPEVRRAAEQIVEETWGDGAAASATPASGDSSWLAPLWPRAAHAQEPDINVSTAAIRAVKDQMRTRSAQLRPHLDAGRVGIARDGMLAVRNLDGVPLRDQATVRRLVEAENRDRETLYREIARANQFGDERIADIQKIFAETWIDKAEKGWPIENASGVWGVK